MGLDMYLNGEIYLARLGRKRERGERKAEIYDLGYWRKHPDLHGYIVQNFADGVDNCQEIPLSAGNIGQIIEAVKCRQLPFTEGFFFGASDGSERDRDVEIFSEALRWLDAAGPDEWRSVYYQASW